MKRMHVPFALALIVQVALLAAVPGKRVVDGGGREIWLKVRASEDQEIWRGNYLDLTYEISDGSLLRGEPQPGGNIYVVLRETPGGVWEGLRAETALPIGLPGDEVAIRGEVVDRGLQVHAFLHESDDGTWAADSVITTRSPRRVDETQQDSVALARAWVSRPAIAFPDIESYFVPESARAQLEAALRVQSSDLAVQVRVNESGRAALLQLRIGDRVYEY